MNLQELISKAELIALSGRPDNAVQATFDNDFISQLLLPNVMRNVIKNSINEASSSRDLVLTQTVQFTAGRTALPTNIITDHIDLARFRVVGNNATQISYVPRYQDYFRSKFSVFGYVAIENDFLYYTAPSGSIDAATDILDITAVVMPHIPVTSTGNITLNIPVVKNFATTDVSTAADTITIADHGLSNMQKVRFTTTGTLPAGLSLATDYYVMYSSPSLIQVSSTYDPANPALVNITSQGTGTHTVTSQDVLLANDVVDDIVIDLAKAMRGEGVYQFLGERQVV